MKNILQTYIDKGRAKDIILTYNTNITRLPAHVLKLWPHFKEVRLLVSIDAYGELNDYIRPPSKWCEVDANLRFLNDNASDLKITQIMLNTTVQAYNILGLRDLCEYLEQFENVISLPNFILLHYPLYYQANIITNEQKEKAFEDLNFIYKRNFLKIPKNLGYLLKNILQIKNFIQVQPTDEQKEQFIQVTNKLDKIHGKILEDKWWR
jgi:sulfatase maturation enzyme AslB (radical SAM superfamily)